MAFFSATYSAAPTFGERLSKLRDDINTARAKRRVYRTTLNELSALNARELADLGIAQANIRSVAYEAAYGTK